MSKKATDTTMPTNLQLLRQFVGRLEKNNSPPSDWPLLVRLKYLGLRACIVEGSEGRIVEEDSAD